MYFALEWAKEGPVGSSVVVEFIPLSFMINDREILQSFFDEDQAIVAVLVSWVFCWYYMDMGVGQTRRLVVKVCKV